MKEILGLMSGMRACADMMSNYESRKIARTKSNGVTVSTAYTPDEGYETAIIDSDGIVYPVERYRGRDAAVTGHAKWVEFGKSDTKEITCLDGLIGCVPERPVTLKR